MAFFRDDQFTKADQFFFRADQNFQNSAFVLSKSFQDRDEFKTFTIDHPLIDFIKL